VERLTALKTEHGIQKEMIDKTGQGRYQIREREEIKDSCYVEAKLSTRGDAVYNRDMPADSV